jgi:6-phosphogluconolactonase (cycloisomerase 2 family)
MGRGRLRLVLGAATALLLVALGPAVAQAVFGSLTFVEQERKGVNGVAGLEAADDLAASPDGANVYVVGQNDSAIATFTRDATTGELTFVEFEQDDQGGVDGIQVTGGTAVSPDGLSVYATGANDNAVATFSRVPPTGELDWVELEKDGVGGVDGLGSPRDVVVSPDGDHVYVASLGDSAVSAFTRDPGNGTLTFIDLYQDGVGTIDGLAGAQDLAMSPDGSNVYVTGANEHALATFSRNATTGALTFVDVEKDGVGGADGLMNPSGVAASPDGVHVYVASRGDDSVATFARDPGNGALSFAGLQRDGVGGADGLGDAGDVAVTPDGFHVYVASSGDSAVAMYTRDPATGLLAFVEQDVDGVDGVDGIGGAQNLTIAPSGAQVYVTGRNDDAVAIFTRAGPDADGAPDTDPPETTIAKGPKRKSKKRRAKFEFASDEPGSTFQCRLDKGDFEPCDPAETFKVKRGRHSIEVRAVDAAGNADPTPAAQGWKVKKKRKKKK